MNSFDQVLVQPAEAAPDRDKGFAARLAAGQGVPTLVLLFGVFAALYAGVMSGLVAQWWRDPNYSHGFLVPAFSAWMAWRRREEFAARPARPSLWGFVLVLGSVAMLFLGSLGAELFLARGSMIGVLIGLLVYFQGWGRVRALAFPLAFLFFMVPLPAVIYYQIVFPLQLLASRLAGAAIEVFIPVLREGNLLILPHYTLEVVEACSGIRSLFSLLALAAGYAYLVEPKWLLRCVLVALMVPIAIVANAIRIMLTAALTVWAGPESADGFLHAFSGWAIFLVSVVFMLLFHKLMTFAQGRFARRAA